MVPMGTCICMGHIHEVHHRITIHMIAALWGESDTVMEQVSTAPAYCVQQAISVWYTKYYE